MHVFIDKFEDYYLDKIIAVLRQRFKELDLWRQLKNKQIILIKPNLLGPYSPREAVTTHPAIVEAVIILLQEKLKDVWLGDSPGGSVKASQTFEKTGISELADKYNVELVNFSEFGIIQMSKNQIDFGLSGVIDQVDAIINISKYKTHTLMYYTGAIKNLYGLIPGLKKSDYHKTNPDYNSFARVITSLYSLVRSRITLNIMDGIYGMEGEGPSAGSKRKFGVLFTSLSASALDFMAARMMGLKIDQMGYILDSLKEDELTPDDISTALGWKSFKFKKVKFKKISLLIKLITISPGFLKKIFSKIYKYEPDFNEKCIKCGICLESCPVQAISLDGNMKIDYSKCIKCMCCHELCPHHAVYIRKSWLAKRIIK